MTTPQQEPPGTNDPNAQSASAPSSAGSSTSSRGTSGGTSGSTSGGTSSAGGSTGNREAQSTARDTERSIPVTGEGTRSRRSEGGGRNQAARTGTPGLTRWGLPPSPWELLRRMSEDVNRAVESLSAARSGTAPRTQQQSSSAMVPTSADMPSTDITNVAAWVPDVEVLRQPNDLIVRVDLPAVAPDEIDVAIEDGLLTIAGERRQENREERDGFVRSERSYGTFFRTIILPEGADESRVEAKFDNGVLEIDVPIASENRSRRIDVRS